MQILGGARSGARILVVQAFVCALMLASTAATARTLDTTRVIARGGDASPDGSGSLFEIVSPIVIGSSGQVAFSSDIRDQGFLTGFGIFRCSDATDLTLIARSSASGSGPVTGWPAPDGNGNFYPFDDPPLVINGSGAVAFAARLTGTLAPTESEGIFLGTGGQAGLVQIARGNELVLGTSDRIFDLRALSGAAPGLNDAGEVAFYASIGAAVPNAQAILRGDGSDEGLVEIARSGQSTPDETAVLLTLSPPSPLDAAGAVGFSTCFQAGGCGILQGSGGALSEIARSGDASPDGNGSFLALLPPATFDEAGEAAFYAVLAGTTGGSGDNQGIFRGDGANLAVIARRGELTPGGNGHLLDISPNSLAFDDLGQVLFASTITGATNGSSEGIFRGSGGALTAIARVGDPTPTGVGTFAHFESLTLASNENGQAVFQAFIDLGDGGGTNDTEGLFFFDDAHGLRELVRRGDVIPGAGTVEGLAFTGATTGQGKGTSGLNASGEVAYRVTIGGDFEVAVAPEAEQMELEAASSVTLLLLARRARRTQT